MRRVAIILLLGVVACSGETGASTTVRPSETSTSTPATTLAQQDCGVIPYQVDTLPDRVVGETPPTDAVAQDVFTTVPGTVSRLWFDESGDLAVVLVRGSLPPIEWPGERGEVSIDGARGVAGALEDGTWMVGWFEGEGEPCDRYFMVFYSPVETSEVEDTIASLNRTAG